MPATVDLTNPIFTDLEKARAHFEAIRWPDGPYCPYCGTFDRVAVLGGKSMGPGWYHCKDCRKKFTAAVGTIYERSHSPLTKWLLATHLMCASKKGMSAHQLHRMMGLPYKTAWFMAHRIREAMLELHPVPVGGEGKTIEADETYVGGKERNKHRSKRNANNIGSVGKVRALAKHSFSQLGHSSSDAHPPSPQGMARTARSTLAMFSCEISSPRPTSVATSPKATKR
jgi:transposase-like protein